MRHGDFTLLMLILWLYMGMDILRNNIKGTDVEKGPFLLYLLPQNLFWLRVGEKQKAIIIKTGYAPVYIKKILTVK